MTYDALRKISSGSAINGLISMMLAFCLLSAGMPAAAQQLTPAQVAYVKAETRKADEAYVKEVAGVVGVRSSTVSRIMPEHGRITDPVARMIAALEQSLGKPLSDDQKAGIQAADMQRQKHIEWAAMNARKR